MKKLLFAPLVIGLASLFVVGCKSPEERLADQMDAQMRRQVYLMERMKKTMDEASKRMEQMGNQESEQRQVSSSSPH